MATVNLGLWVTYIIIGHVYSIGYWVSGRGKWISARNVKHSVQVGKVYMLGFPFILVALCIVSKMGKVNAMTITSGAHCRDFSFAQIK